MCSFINGVIVIRHTVVAAIEIDTGIALEDIGSLCRI
ncbi:hypothetical protein MTY_1744 [Moorella thermoacetica Y72]|uniref:Uncharacterized protein n=1 Tax=Moorella thermoacetica Y72 TaxID=1325331 RepID=A0A0S6UDT3_NEOTH|nr:hypothetical protein MTY_1744 [Moorella thermoacetica Y72]